MYGVIGCFIEGLGYVEEGSRAVVFDLLRHGGLARVWSGSSGTYSGDPE